MPAVKDFYQILGVSPTATTAEIKKAYRRLAKKHHPDANQGAAAAAERFKEISEAHSVLSDPGKRRQYDLMRKYGAFAGAGDRARGGGRARGGAGGGGGAAGSTRVEDFDIGGFGGFGGLGDLFSSIFGRGRKEEVEAVEVTVEIPFRVAALGGKVQVDVPVTEACPTCGGSGAAPGAQITTCQECNGRGTVTFGQGGFAVSRPCPACRGRGKVASQPCATCSGQGEVAVIKRLMVTVPPGTDSGHRVRLKDQGQRHPGGQQAGDLVINFTVQPDRFFRREGLDLYCTVPINPAQAVLGTKLRVRALDGKRVLLRVPPGTQPGRKFRIRGYGIERSGQRGDQYVEVTVQIPERLTPEQEKLFKQFADAAGLKY